MPASEEPKRRMVKKAETVRQIAEKSQQQADKPKKRSITRLTGHYSALPFVFIGRPFTKIGRKLGRLKPFRIAGLILLPRYVRNSWKELRLVTWPNRRETRQLTAAVIIFSIIFGVIIFGVDFVLEKLFKEVLLK